MKKMLILLLSTCFHATGWATSQSYDYPFEDKFLSTVIGTPQEYRPELPKVIPVTKGLLTVFEDREPPEWFWYEDGLRYSYALQDDPAPLVFLIAGTGGSHSGAKIINMARAFYSAGFHTVMLSSPTHSNFIVTASHSSVPGHAMNDAEDLYRVMELIWKRLKSTVTVTEFSVAGYSLGGFNAAFVAYLDEERKTFKFRKALMINPPVRLYDSISVLDRMVENIPGGADNFNRFFQEAVTAFTRVFQYDQSLDLSEDALYRAFEIMQPKHEELAALIGVSFRISSANLSFTSDVMTDFGYVKPKNITLTPNSSTQEYHKVVHRLGFTDYFHNFFYPYYKAKNPSVTREQLINSMSLGAIEDYLRTSDKVEVMHNEDDLILLPGEIEFFRGVFGKRAKIYPVGGHCGNMEHRDNVAHMISVLKH
jgi:predicted alpha/beta-fold hydrolase